MQHGRYPEQVLFHAFPLTPTLLGDQNFLAPWMRHAVDWMKYDCTIPEQAVPALLQAGIAIERFTWTDLYPGKDKRQPDYFVQQSFSYRPWETLLVMPNLQSEMIAMFAERKVLKDLFSKAEIAELWEYVAATRPGVHWCPRVCGQARDGRSRLCSTPLHRGRFGHGNEPIPCLSS